MFFAKTDKDLHICSSVLKLFPSIRENAFQIFKKHFGKFYE